jgi:hypothetical protein
MKKEMRAMLSLGCIVTLLAVYAIGTASAATVSFTGTESSVYYSNGTAGFSSEINQNIGVRNGDSMQFQNRWVNARFGYYVDYRISYGGAQQYTCTGVDTTVAYNMGYLSYYPSSTETLSQYSTVTASSGGPYKLLVNHQYVYNGLNIPTQNTQTMKFQL